MSETSNFCPNCGSKLPPESICCPQCGSKIGQRPIMTQNPSTQPIAVQPTPQQPNISQPQAAPRPIGPQAPTMQPQYSQTYAPQQKPHQHAQQSGQRRVASQKNDKKSNAALIISIIVGVIVLIGIGVGIYLYMSSSSNDKKSVQNQETPIHHVHDEDEILEETVATTAKSDYEIAFDKVYANQLLDDSDLYGLSNDELRKLRNLPFAQMGRTFQSADLQEYFSRFDWYTPVSRNIDLYDLTAIDRQNIDLIQKYER